MHAVLKLPTDTESINLRVPIPGYFLKKCLSLFLFFLYLHRTNRLSSCLDGQCHISANKTLSSNTDIFHISIYHEVTNYVNVM